jgi:RNase P/RNase MRP subunit p29
MKLKKIALSFVLATLVLSLGSVAWAAEPQQGCFLCGQVTAIVGTTLVLDTLQGEKQVTTDEAIFWAPDVENPSLADVQVGDQVVARGRPDEDGSLAARLVAIASAEELREHAVRGRVTAVEGQTLVITTREGEKEVVTTSETYFHIPNVEEPGLDDIEVGRIITALGQEDGGTFTAQIVAVARARRLRKMIVRRNMAGGEVTAIEGTTLTVETRQGEKTILTDENTRFRIPEVESPSIENIKVGDRIVALGRRTEDGDFVARVVGVPKGRGLS